MHAGADLLMWGDEKQVTDIVECIKNKSLPLSDLDKNVRCMLELIVKTPHFRKYKFSDAPDLKAHAKIVREAGNEGIVLLQNDYNVLPLKNVKNIALLGKGSYNFLAGGTGSGNVNRPYVVNMEQGLENNGYVINKDISSRYKASEDRLSEMNAFFFKDRANDCDVAVLTISRNSGEGGDRRDIEGDFYLTKSEKDLLYATSLAFHRAGKKVIVVLNVSGVIETASWKDEADAIVLAWQPGEEGGNCVADILSGKENPSGKLTMTFPENYWVVPSAKNFPNNYVPYQGDHDDPKAQQTKNVGFTNYDEGIWIGYRYFNTKNVKVSFPFGYGLSYTSFAYTQPEIKKSGDNYIAKVKVTNVGNVAGKEIVELYVSAPAGKLEKPAMELKGFNKTRLLGPGESQTIEMKFTKADLASFDEANNSWVIDKGAYKAMFASSSRSIINTLDFNLSKVITKKMKAVI